MKWNNHKDLEDKHAVFSPSQPFWLKYSDEKAIDFFENMKAKERGTELHDWAQKTINLKIRQSRAKKTLYMYVNDCIDIFKIDSDAKTERTLKYSDNFFGTADFISFKNGYLRIYDLKTGITPAHMEQLLIYAALFCLEYSIDPMDISIELRIYQKDECIVHNPSPMDIRDISKRIIQIDNILTQNKGGLIQ